MKPRRNEDHEGSGEDSQPSGGANSHQSAIRNPQSAIRSIPVPVRLGLVLILFALSSVAWFLYINRAKPPVLTDKDTLLLAEFENRTGEAVFDGALRQGLAVLLQQSPFLDLFPDARIRQTLQLMQRAPDERLTHEVAREVAQRQGLKALLTGSLAKVDRHYSIKLEALDSQTGATIGLTQAEAESKEAVLRALSEAAAELRGKLGEKLITIRRFAAPLEMTGSSFDAFKAYTLGNEAQARGQHLAAVPLYQRAVELDSDFALAYSGLAAVYGNTQRPALAIEAATKAFALRERVSELENFRLTFLYHALVTGKLEKCVEVLKQQQRSYPRDLSVYDNLVSTYSKLGQSELAAETAAEAVRRNPPSAAAH